MTKSVTTAGCMLRVLAVLLIPLVVCGGLFFGYQTYDMVREAVVLNGLPEIESPPIIKAASQPTAAPAPNIAAGERVNVLLMGTDCRAVDHGLCRTDSMMIASLDPKTLSAGVVSIPRDLYVPIPDFREDRINVAYYYGTLYKFPGGGPGLAKRTVEYNLGRRIHFYVLIDFDGFRRAIDTLGGIDIDVPRVIDDPLYPDENNGYSPLYIPAGRQHMNGELALKYARTRHVDGDYGRMRRQIQVMLAVREKAMRLDMLSKLPTLMQSMGNVVKTDMTAQDVLALAPIARQVKPENIKTGSIDQTMTVQFRANTGANVLWADRAKIGKLMDEVIPQDVSDQTKRVQQEAARIIVLNGTTRPLLAEQTTKYLQAQGLQVISYGNADRTDYSKSVLIDYNGAKTATLDTLTKLLRVTPDNVRQTPSSKSDTEFRVILGADWTLGQ
ncbi:MAG: LCP family protein [Chloroflexi bacterium]|nr:LCP family protein [Chloroflexota bacterium]